MKILCLQEDLRKGLAIVGRAVATRTVLPITTNVLLATDQSRFKLAATNLDIGISSWIEGKVEGEGAIAVPAKLLGDFVSSLPSEKVNLNIPADSHTLELRCGRLEAHISGQDAEEFPPIPKIDEGTTVKIAPEVLSRAIEQVAFASATDESRPVLTGVYAEFEEKKLTLAAADGFRLAVHELFLDSPVPEKMGVIIPARTLLELERLLSDQEEAVTLTLNPQKSQALFKLENVELVSQLLQGTFPNYKQLIPKDYATRAQVSVSDFTKIARSVFIFARDTGGVVRLQMTSDEEASRGKITASARDEEVGDNIGEIDAVIEGEAAKIAFNGKYLLDVLNVLQEDELALEVTTPSNPGVIRPVGNDKYVHIIMPMFVQW